MPVYVWKKLSPPELTSTRMTLELANRSVAIPTGVAEDVFVKVIKFYFLADFVVVDYDVDPWVPLILGRPFLRTARFLIDVHGEELPLRINDKAVTFKVEHTSRYSRNSYDEMVHQVNVIDVTYDVSAQEVLGFLDSSTSGNPTPSDPIISSSSLSFTPFEGSDFILEDIETFLRTPDELTNLNDDYYDTEGDILYLEKLLNEDPSPNLPLAIAWKIFDIKGIDPHFCTHKILIEDDFKPAVQHQRRVNPEIHKVIKKEVIKLLDAGLIYPISDSPWVSPVHCVPKKGGVTVIKNEDNELIPTRLIVYADHSTLKYLLAKQDAKPRFLWWILLLQEFDVIIRDKKGAENLAADQLSRLENPHQEAKALSTNDARVVVKFLKSLFDQFGTPRAIISDRGTHFCIDQFSKVMLKYGVTYRLSIAYHLQTSVQVEVLNRGLIRILERTVGENRASWSDKLDDALWAFRTAFKTPIGHTPYKLVYEKAYHLPIKLEHKAYWALKHCNFDLKTASDHQKVQMNELNELRDQAYENSFIYKEKTKKIHDFKIKNCVFNVGDRVLLFNSQLKIFSSKLKTHWTGPFTVTQVFPYGTLELSQTDRPTFKGNGHGLKHYFGGDIPHMVVPDLQTFSMDH
nr:reverse transcriptase domain-containing protein [Tanacetum cinerariifolium]